MSELDGQQILRVDLDSGKIERFTIGDDILRKFIGGVGIGAKFLYDEVPPGVEWSNPQNRIIFTGGPLSATAIGGSGTVSVVSKGPLTNGAGCSQANGFFGAFLRLCGLMGIIVQGASKKLQYLYVDSGSAELRDADWLKGVDTYRTADLLKHEYGRRQPEMAVASIGPAGENMVKFAGIFIDHGHSASHNGLGAVMGSKKLKAIAVNRPANKQVAVHNPEALRTVAKTLIEDVKKLTKNFYDYGTLFAMQALSKANQLPVKNYTTNKWPIDDDKLQKFAPEYIRKFSLKRDTCWGCQLHHCDIMRIDEGPYAGEVLEEPDYEPLAASSSVIGQNDVTPAMMLTKEIDALGMDSNEAGWVMGFAMECYEKGILTKEKANNIDLSWGNAEGARLLLNLIANRQGVGDLLAEGAMRAANTLGSEATKMAIHTMKGNTPRGHDHRNRTTEQFDTSVSNTGTIETWSAGIPIGPVPEWEATVDTNLHDKGAMMFEDSLLTCRFNTRTNVDLLSQALSAATGWNFSSDDAFFFGKRIVQLLRSFNVRHGVCGRNLDRPSARYGSAPDFGPGQGKSLESVWDKMLDKYYAGMGWNNEGKPLPQTLESFGLSDVARDLWK